jgi:hypothetical protein
MKVSKTNIGSTPYISNVRVYSAGQIYEGALMMLAYGALSLGAPADGSKYYFSIAARDDASAALDTLGAVNCSSQFGYLDRMNNANNAAAFKIGADYYADAAISVGGNYLPVCITPDVLYMAEYLQKADNAGGANVISANISASTSTTVTITDLQDHLDGGFLFSTDLTSSTAYEPGQFRCITVSAATGSCTIDSAMKVSTTTDFILGLPPSCTRTGLSDDAVGLCSLTDKTADDASVGLCQGLLIWDNYIEHRVSGSVHPVRYWVDRGQDDLKNFRAYAEVYLTDHLFGRTKPA